MANKWARENNPDSFGSVITEYTPADQDLPAYVKAVFFDADGTITVKNINADGTVGSAIAGIPVTKGMELRWIPGRITAMSGPTKCYLVS